jgi:hypothetical protein
MAIDSDVRSNLVIVSMTSIHFLAGVVKAKEPVLIQALLGALSDLT